MKIFLTGGTGFIGSYFIATSLSAGHTVKALRRSRQSTTAVQLHIQPDWLEGSLNSISPRDLIGFDAVVHLASSGISPRQVSWDELVEVNVKGTAHLIEIARTAGVGRVIIAGTSHEYGATAYKYNPIPASAPLEPLNLYGASKAAAFHLAVAYARTHKTFLYYGRIFSVYGEGQFNQNFWPSLCNAALSGKDFPMSSGCQVRDFIHVIEVAKKLLYSCIRDDITQGEPFVENIASGKPQSLLDFARCEWERLGGEGKLLPGMLCDRKDEAQFITAETTIPQEIQ